MKKILDSLCAVLEVEYYGEIKAKVGALKQQLEDAEGENKTLHSKVSKYVTLEHDLVLTNKGLKQEVEKLRSALEQAWTAISSGGAGIERAKVILAQALKEGE